MAVNVYTSLSNATVYTDKLQITTGANVVTYQPLREGLGLSSRRTRIVFSEIQYHPQTLPGSPGLEFVELYNAGDVFEDLSRWKI